MTISAEKEGSSFLEMQTGRGSNKFVVKPDDPRRLDTEHCSLEIEDWGLKPDNDDIGGTISVRTYSSSLVAVNGNISHVQYQTEGLETTAMFDILKSGQAEMEILTKGRAKELVKFNHQLD